MPKFNNPVIFPKALMAEKESTASAFSNQEKAVAEALWVGPQSGLLDSRKTYILNAEGKWEPKPISTYMSAEAYAMSGRLFARDDNGFLRQIQMAEDEFGNLTLDASAPIRQVAPRRPSIWTYIAAIFSRACRNLIREYGRHKQFNVYLQELANNPDYNIDLNPDPVQQPQEENPVAQQQVEQKPEVQQSVLKSSVVQPAGPNFARMSSDEFRNYLNNQSMAMDLGFADTLRRNNENPFVSDYYDAFARNLYAKALFQLRVFRGEYTREQKQTFQAMENGLKEFVRVLVSEEDAKNYLRNGRGNERGVMLGRLHQQIMFQENIMELYRQYLRHRRISVGEWQPQRPEESQQQAQPQQPSAQASARGGHKR